MTEKQKSLKQRAWISGKENISSYFFGNSLAKVKDVQEEEVLLELLFYPFVDSDTKEEVIAPNPNLFTRKFEVLKDDYVWITQTRADIKDQSQDKVDYFDKWELSNCLIVEKMTPSKKVQGLLEEWKNSSLNLDQNLALLAVGDDVSMRLTNLEAKLEALTTQIKANSVVIESDDVNLGGTGGALVLTANAVITAPAGTAGGACTITFTGSTKTKAL